MSSIEILNENTLNLAELKDKLDSVKKRDENFNVRSMKTYDYINKFLKKTDDKKIEDIKKKLSAVDIGRLKERHIIKLIDIMPADLESLKLILTGEEVTLKLEDLTKIIEVIKKYAK